MVRVKLGGCHLVRCVDFEEDKQRMRIMMKARDEAKIVAREVKSILRFEWLVS